MNDQTKLNEDLQDAYDGEERRTAPYVVATIHKSAVEHLPVTVHPHELLVLARVHGGPHKIQIEENADLPDGLTEGTFDPETEYARLEQFYGVHPDTSVSYVQMEFGSLEGFVARLDAIENSGAPKAKAAPKKTAAKKG